MEQPRIVFWQAVSSEEQATDKESLDYQRERNLEHAARWNGVVVDELIVDESRNIVLWEDARDSIEAYAKLDSLIKRKAFDILMCMDATRLGRTRAIITTMVSLCERAGIRIYETSSPPSSITGPVATADMQLLMLFKSHQSEQEIKKFAERSYFGRQARIRKGKHSGVPPYGYTRAFDSKGIAYLVIDEEQAEIVRLFYDLYLNHSRSLRAICDELNGRGIYSPRSKRPWVPGNARQFLLNCWTYAGYTTWGAVSKNIPKHERFRAKAEWPPIISEETARKVTAILKQRAQAPRAVSSPHRLSMVAKCGYCGSTVTVVVRAGTSGCATNRYLCVNRCTGSRIGEPDMMAEIHAFVLALQDAAYLESLIEETPDHYETVASRLIQTTKAMEGVRDQRRKLTLAFTRDAISLEEYEAIMAELQARHDDLARTVAELEDILAATPTAERRRERLEEVRDSGLAMLTHNDQRTANRWLREYIELIIVDYRVDSFRFI